MADGTTVTRKVGDSYFEFNGIADPHLFVQKGNQPVVTTLESLGLGLDPFKRRLIPMRMVLVIF